MAPSNRKKLGTESGSYPCKHGLRITIHLWTPRTPISLFQSKLAISVFEAVEEKKAQWLLRLRMALETHEQQQHSFIARELQTAKIMSAILHIQNVECFISTAAEIKQFLSLISSKFLDVSQFIMKSSSHRTQRYKLHPVN